MADARHPVRKMIVCDCCGKVGRARGHGWRETCFKRWQSRGMPDGGPPPLMTLEERRAAHRRDWPVSKAENLKRAENLFHFWANASAREIADELGVSVRTVTRYRAELENRT
jgi:hypothetical protein